MTTTENQVENEAIDFIKYLIEKIISEPDKIEISEHSEDGLTIISLKVDKQDMGKLIGKNGQTIKSIRSLLSVMGAKLNQRFILKISEP